MCAYHIPIFIFYHQCILMERFLLFPPDPLVPLCKNLLVVL